MPQSKPTPGIYPKALTYNVPIPMAAIIEGFSVVYPIMIIFIVSVINTKSKPIVAGRQFHRMS